MRSVIIFEIRPNFSERNVNKFYKGQNIRTGKNYGSDGDLIFFNYIKKIRGEKICVAATCKEMTRKKTQKRRGKREKFLMKRLFLMFATLFKQPHV